MLYGVHSNDDVSVNHHNIVMLTPVAFSDYRFVIWLLWRREGPSELVDLSCSCLVDHSSMCCLSFSLIPSVSSCLSLSFFHYVMYERELEETFLLKRFNSFHHQQVVEHGNRKWSVFKSIISQAKTTQESDLFTPALLCLNIIFIID